MANIAVTGVTGHVGGLVAKLLSSRGDDTLVLLARDASRVAEAGVADVPRVAGADIAFASYHDGPAVERALARTDIVFMVSAREHADRLEHHFTFIEAAARAGVRHIVYTSFVGAGDASRFTLAREHGATEQAIRDTGLDYTFLRDNFYLDLLPEFADRDGVIRGPAGTGTTAAVARADVADAAVSVLLHPAQHIDTVYELTGREALTLAEVARRASVATGRPFSFVDETIEEARASWAHYGAPDWQVEAWISTYTAIAAGELAHVSRDVLKLTGHEPRVLEDLFQAETLSRDSKPR